MALKFILFYPLVSLVFCVSGALIAGYTLFIVNDLFISSVDPSRREQTLEIVLLLWGGVGLVSGSLAAWSFIKTGIALKKIENKDNNSDV